MGKINISPDPRKAVLDLKSEMISLRREFHQYPELGLNEERTAERVADRLRKIGLEVKTGVGRTGVVGLLKGKRPGKTVLLRADMDALPIVEKNDVDFRSKIDGVMHACGHDGHMASLLTAAKILAFNRDSLEGQVKFVFQPGEEGFAGAKLMIQDGVMDDPIVDAAFALHLLTHFPVGKVVACPGRIMASMDSFDLKIIGKSSHAARPEQGADAILMSAHAVNAIQSLISKEVSPLVPLVVHIGTIEGGSAFNVVADLVEMKGTVRTHDHTLRETMPQRIDRIVGGIVSALNGKHELDYHFGYPPVVNDSDLTNLVKEVAKEVLGPDCEMDSPVSMGSDDMAYFLDKVPGCYFWVGAGNEIKGFIEPNHSPRFNFDEDALTIGTELMVRIALDYLKTS